MAKKYNNKKNSKGLSQVKTYGQKNSKEISQLEIYTQKTQRRYHIKKYILKKTQRKYHWYKHVIKNSKDASWLKAYGQKKLKGDIIAESIQTSTLIQIWMT